MSSIDFEALCAGFAELIQAPVPPLAPDEDGALSFHIVRRDVPVDVMFLPRCSEHHVFVFFALGPMERPGAEPIHVAHAMLEANFLALQPEPLVFARHPDTGHAVLQRIHALEWARPDTLNLLIDEGVAQSLEWRSAAFEPEDAPA